MKHKMLKNPNRAQKEIIQKNGLNWREWLIRPGIAGEDNIALGITHKITGEKRVIFK